MFQYNFECIEKCPENSFLDESTFICYDNCTDNIYNNKTFNFNKICVDYDPSKIMNYEFEDNPHHYSDSIKENESEENENNNIEN